MVNDLFEVTVRDSHPPADSEAGALPTQPLQEPWHLPTPALASTLRTRLLLPPTSGSPVEASEAKM